MSTIFSTAPPTRVTLLDQAGAAVARWTLQHPTREGRKIRFVPEGQLRQLGSGTAWQRAWAHKGFRLELGLQWGVGLTSQREAWTGSAWAAAVELPTATAHCEILDWAAQYQVQVEPFVGQPMPTFLAQATEKGPALSDTKGVVHPLLELALVATALASQIWLTQALGWGIGPFGLLPWGD
jgi:hypothetical protein